MKYVIIGVCIVGVVIIAALLIYRKKKTDNAASILAEQNDGSLMAGQKDLVSQPDKNFDELVIHMEMLPAESIPDEGKLVEITDSKVLAHVNNLVPGLAQAGLASNNAVQAGMVLV